MSMLSSNESMKLMLLLKQFLVTGTDTENDSENRPATKVNKCFAL